MRVIFGIIVASLCFAFCVDGALDGISSKAKKSKSWSKSVAKKETEKDIKKFLDEFDRDKSQLKKIVKEFEKKGSKNDGIRNVAAWGTSLFRLLTIDSNAEGRISSRLEYVADLLLDAYSYKESYVENRRMHGWPMYLYRGDKEKVHDTLNSAYILAAVSKAAYVKAKNGDHDKATKFIEPVIETLYDNYFSGDVEKIKLDKDDIPVTVPDKASSGRHSRYKRAVRGNNMCLDDPLAYNKALNLGRAMISTLKAIDEIDWKKKDWPINDWQRSKAVKDMEDFVKRVARWWEKGWKKRDNKLFWKYRDLCREMEGGIADRPEDIVHGAVDMAFVEEYVEWGEQNDISKNDVERLIRTFRKDIVVDRSEDDGKRFACDITGETKDNKQCRQSRSEDNRSKAAARWIVVSHLGKNKCEGAGMAWDVLDLALDPKKKSKFDKISQDWTSEVIKAKYYHYNKDGRC